MPFEPAMRSFTEELQSKYGHSPHQSLTSMWIKAGAEILTHAADMLVCGNAADMPTLLHDLTTIMTQAHTKMALSSGSDALALRHIYTDSRILLAFADLVRYHCNPDITLAEAAIAHLDHAIVIAGAPGDGVLDYVLDLIASIQLKCVQHSAQHPPDLSAIAPGIRGVTSGVTRLRTATNEVPRFDAPPSLATFATRLSQSPFVLPGYLRDSPALNERPWSSLAYLRAVAGPGRVVPVEVGSDYRADDWTQKMMRWDAFLDALQDSERGSRTEVLYLAQHSLFNQFPALRDDIVVPDYVYAALEPPEDYPAYRPPGNDEQLVLNAWLGPAGAVSPAHTDPYFNFYAQVVGRKTVWLAPPRVSAFMYPYPDATTTATAPSQEDRPRNPAANANEPLLSNTSRVDVFANDAAELHGFGDEVVPVAMQVTLEPGDLLFFPPGWWHAMRSEERSFSLSMWF